MNSGRITTQGKGHGGFGYILKTSFKVFYALSFRSI